MNITKEKINDYTVLTIEGRMDTSNAAAFEDAIAGIFSEGGKNIVFNCSGLKYISSSGLRVFLIAQKKAVAIHGKLHLCNLQPAIKEIFDIAGFSAIFKIFNAQEEALDQ